MMATLTSEGRKQIGGNRVEGFLDGGLRVPSNAARMDPDEQRAPDAERLIRIA